MMDEDDVMQRVHDLKMMKIKHREELRRQQQDALHNPTNYNPTDPTSIYLGRYEASLRKDLSYAERKAGKNQLDIKSSSVESCNSSSTLVDDDEVVENSFEKSSSSAINLDDVPVTNMVCGKTFEQAIEEQLKKEGEQQNNDKVQSTPKKKTFLRKGQGTARFNGPLKKPPKYPRRSTTTKAASKEPTKKAAPQKLLILKPALQKSSSLKSPMPKFDAAKPELPKQEPEKAAQLNFDLEIPPMPKIAEVEEAVTADNDAGSMQVALVSKNVIKAPVRKTARLISKKEPMRTLKLLPIEKSKPESSNSQDDQAIAEPAPAKDEKLQVEHEQGFGDDEVWSNDGLDDTVLTLQTTAIENIINSPHDDSNSVDDDQEFLQLEKFCMNPRFNNMRSSHIGCEPLLRLNHDEDKENNVVEQTEEKPRNKLMQNLFPSLRCKQQPSKKKTEATEAKVFQPEYYVDPERVQPSEQSGAILKSKLEELQAEIKRFQRESQALTKSRSEYEENAQNLKQQISEFEEAREKELKELDEFRKKERSKLKKDRRMFDDFVQTTKKSLPLKEDKERISELEADLERRQAEGKVKEERLMAINSRLRTQVDTVTGENARLKSRVEELEAEVLKMEKAEAKRRSKESNRMWKEINELVDAAAPTPPPPQPLAECNLPTARYIASSSSQDSSKQPHDRKHETRHKDGSLEIIYHNDTKKLVSADGKTVQLTFGNGDVRTTLPDGTETYFYRSSGTRRTTHKDGVQVVEFSNDQVERHFVDGSKHITFADGSSKLIRADGFEETQLKDGTLMRVHCNGERSVHFPNGQRELHTADFKRREYPDGTCKTVFVDGRQETKYASGRLRLKNPQGVVIFDSVVDKK